MFSDIHRKLHHNKSCQQPMSTSNYLLGLLLVGMLVVVEAVFVVLCINVKVWYVGKDFTAAVASTQNIYFNHL